MDPTNSPSTAPRRPGQAGVHRLGLALAALAAVATFAGAAATTGWVGPGSAPTATSVASVTDGADMAPTVETLIRTVYVPAPQPAATPEPPVKVIVINKPPRGDDEDDEGHESEGD